MVRLIRATSRCCCCCARSLSKCPRVSSVPTPGPRATTLFELRPYLRSASSGATAKCLSHGAAEEMRRGLGRAGGAARGGGGGERPRGSVDFCYGARATAASTSLPGRTRCGDDVPIRPSVPPRLVVSKNRLWSCLRLVAASLRVPGQAGGARCTCWGDEGEALGGGGCRRRCQQRPKGGGQGGSNGKDAARRWVLRCSRAVTVGRLRDVGGSRRSYRRPASGLASGDWAQSSGMGLQGWREGDEKTMLANVHGIGQRRRAVAASSPGEEKRGGGALQ